MSVSNTAVRALNVKNFMIMRLFALLFAILVVYATIPMSAHAASLTPTQLQAVTSLLKSFNVDSETVGAIEVQLQGLKSSEDSSSDNTKRPQKPERPEGRGGGQGMPAGVSKNNFSGASACAMLMRNLRKGDAGEEVSRLQEYLREEGDLDNASATSFFGDKTEQALKNWQARMGVADKGSAETHGFGVLGPKTRKMLMERCKENRGVGSHSSTTPPQIPRDNVGTYDPSKPVCILKPSRNRIKLGESVTLKWESKNATWASTASGDKGAPSGSVTMTPTETTTYVKLVYNEAGQGNCTATVEVGTTTPNMTRKIVIAPNIIDLGHLFSLMGSGAAAVMDGYLSLFNLSR